MTKRDSEGNELKAGDTIVFSYGIPPVRVEAPLSVRDGKLVALTHGHKPAIATIGQLRRWVGHFRKLES